MDFECPRCEREVTERFYGPCSWCREELVNKIWEPPAKIINNEMREVYMGMALDLYTWSMMLDAMDLFGMTSNDLDEQSEEEQEPDELGETELVEYDPWAYMDMLVETKMFEDNREASKISNTLRKFLRRVRFSVVIPGAVNMSLEVMDSAFRMNLIDFDTMQNTFLTNNGIYHRQKTEKTKNYAQETDQNAIKEATIKFMSERGTRQMYNQFKHEELDYEMGLREREAGIERKKALDKERNGGVDPEPRSSKSLVGNSRESDDAGERTSASFKSLGALSMLGEKRKGSIIDESRKKLKTRDQGGDRVKWRPAAHKRPLDKMGDGESKFDGKNLF